MTVIKKITENKNIITSSVLTAVLCGFLYFENKSLTVGKYIEESLKISENNDGLCIVQISDLQNTEFGHKNKRLINKIKSLEPDIIVITGDIVDCHRTDIYSALDFAKEISKICKVYYVCGNHEGVLGNYKRLCYDLRENGVIVLNNESVYFDEEKNIRITGMTDPYFGFVKDIPSMLKKKAAEDKNAFNILLSHRPELFKIYAKSGFDIAFCGHAHGGQIRLPFIGGLFSPHQGFLPKYTSGVYQNGSFKMIVSRGLGNSVFPFRIFNRPEIVKVVLKKF